MGISLFSKSKTTLFQDEYDDKVEKMSRAAHENWWRSRQTMLSEFGDTAVSSRKKNEDGSPMTMEDRFAPNFVPYMELDEETKEWDRYEARTFLATIDILPPYITKEQKSELTSCQENLVEDKGMDDVEALIECFRTQKLHCDPMKDVWCEDTVGWTM